MGNVEENDRQMLYALVEKYGTTGIREQLAAISVEGSILSVLCDTGMHRVPEELLAGETHVFSQGTIDTSTDSSVQKHIEASCIYLSHRLREKPYAEIRLFYSGHSLLAAFAKLTCYRVCHIKTVDYGYFSNVGYRKVEIDLRAAISVQSDRIANHPFSKQK